MSCCAVNRSRASQDADVIRGCVPFGAKYGGSGSQLQYGITAYKLEPKLRRSDDSAFFENEEVLTVATK